jgi:hypothetical protein
MLTVEERGTSPPFQLFFWLQTAAFLFHRQFFSRNPLEIEAKTKALMILGLAITFGLSLLNIRQKKRFVEHVVMGAHVWSFLMLTLCVIYTVIPIGVSALAAGHMLPSNLYVGSVLTPRAYVFMIAYLILAIRTVYNRSYPISILQTVALFILYRGVGFIIAKFLIT